jgi:hypothetical protein
MQGEPWNADPIAMKITELIEREVIAGAVAAEVEVHHGPTIKPLEGRPEIASVLSGSSRLRSRGWIRKQWQ